MDAQVTGSVLESPVGGTRKHGRLGDRADMPDVYAFEKCPFRDVAHAVADRSSIVRHTARALWPSARRAERVEISDEGIAAWTLVGQTRLGWGEVTAIGSERTLLGRKTLRIRGAGGRIDVAPVLPGFEELERRVMAGQAAAVAA
jgi:hypothetical protein